MAASTVSTLQSFPAPGSIPPVTFYNMMGLANWLNLNPTYKNNYASTGTFPYLYPQYYSTVFASTSSTFYGYNPENVPLAATVTNLSQYQALKYNTQLQLFQRIYAINSNAYINYISTGNGPFYYNFRTYNEKNDYNAAVQLVNKLYPFRDMANATTWIIPFPIRM
jgi:hypothetical protein